MFLDSFYMFLGQLVVIVAIIIIILLITDVVLYLSRKDKVGKSWYYRTDDGEYVVIYHGQEYVQVEKKDYIIFNNRTPFSLCDELISRAPIDFNDYLRPKILYARISLSSENDYPEYMKLYYGWDGGNTVYLKRSDVAA